MLPPSAPTPYPLPLQSSHTYVAVNDNCYKQIAEAMVLPRVVGQILLRELGEGGTGISNRDDGHERRRWRSGEVEGTVIFFKKKN